MGTVHKIRESAARKILKRLLRVLPRRRWAVEVMVLPKFVWPFDSDWKDPIVVSRCLRKYWRYETAKREARLRNFWARAEDEKLRYRVRRL